MPEEKDIRTMIDEDIDRVERVWEASSYDSDALEELFRLLLDYLTRRASATAAELAGDLHCSTAEADELLYEG